MDYFLPNGDESERLTGQSDAQQQAKTFLRHGVGTIVITRGPDGVLAARNGDQWQAKAYRFASIDPSGAGDAFAAGIVTGILRRWEMPQVLRYAAHPGRIGNHRHRHDQRGLRRRKQPSPSSTRNPLEVTHSKF